MNNPNNNPNNRVIFDMNTKDPYSNKHNKPTVTWDNNLPK